MRAFYLDDKECRCTLQILRELCVKYMFIPLDNSAETSSELLGQLKNDSKCSSEDQWELCRDSPDAAIEAREHTHASDEVRLIVDGDVFVDVRDTADLWVRLAPP